MSTASRSFAENERKTWLDRTLSLFTDVRAGEGATACLMLVNVFLLLVCYSVIKTAREPLILLGGGAEVRSYAAAGQALALMGFVPLYSWFAHHVNRAKLLVGVYLFFLVNIELFALGVAARVPYIGVAFYIWVGIFNLSLIAQFWAYASDIYTKQVGDRLFPIIVVGQTAGAPLGAYLAGHLFRAHLPAQAVLQIAAGLLVVAVVVFLLVHERVKRRGRPDARPLSSGGGFALVWRNPYLRTIAVMMVLLNAVNTTGEYFVSHLVTDHARLMTAADASFDAQAYIGFFYGDYQFWVSVLAFVLQAVVASRLVKYQGLRGVLLALPLIALGGYTVIAAGVGFAVVRWIKTAENATDYSIMNTARQLLWLPTSTDEKYKAKQAIDGFFVRSGDVLSAAIVFAGTAILHLSIARFAVVNVALVLTWLAVAVIVLRRHDELLERPAKAA
jgi:ATP:ADP antiporter, AAA family